MNESSIQSYNQQTAKNDRRSSFGKVAILRTTPQSVVHDYSNLLNLTEYNKAFSKNLNVILKLNLSWTKFYPACSTPPWALDGVIRKLKADGYSKITPIENQTVVTKPFVGCRLNKWEPILEREKCEFTPLTNVEWVPYKPKREILVMNELFDQILVPKIFMGANIIHLPTMKVHGHTTTTGAMKNAFGGLIPKYRHHAHRVIHEVLVDLLTIQQEIHPQILAVMDGTVAGNGAGPRTMVPYYSNLILASFDQVAIDAVSAKIMGFDPLKIPYIKMAHDKGLGIGDVDQIDIMGISKAEFKAMNLHFKTKKSLVIKWDQRLRITTANKRFLHPLHKFLFYSPFFRLFIFGSEAYHDYFWYPTIGKRKIVQFMKSESGWGQLFGKYPMSKERKYPQIKNWNPY